MDPHKKKSDRSDSRNIPKKSVPPPAQQPHQQQRHPSLEGSIPRRKYSNNPSSQSMIIPRKYPPGSSGNGKRNSSSTSTIPRKTSAKRSNGSSLSLTGSIPRRQLDGTSSSGSGSKLSPSSLHSAIPRRNSSKNAQSNTGNISNKYPTARSGFSHSSQSKTSQSGRDNQNHSKGQRLSFKIPPASQRNQTNNKAHQQNMHTSQASHLPRSEHHLVSSSQVSKTSVDRATNDTSNRNPGPNVLSEHPFRILIDLKGVNLANDSFHQNRIKNRSSTRSPPMKRERKRKQSEYQELQDTDSDDFLTDSSSDDNNDGDGDDNYGSKNNKKKKSFSKKVKVKKSTQRSMYLDVAAATTGKNSKTAAANATSITASGISAYQQIPYLGPSVANVGALPATTFLELGNNSFDSPPTGSVASLWYSREVFLTTFVVEKILAWRTRANTQLEWDPESYSEETKPLTSPVIDFATAAKYSEMARSCPLIWRDPKKRMEISRICQQRCPIVTAMAVAQTEGRQTIVDEKSPAHEPNVNNATVTTNVTSHDAKQQQLQPQPQPQEGEKLHKQQDQAHNNEDNRHLEAASSDQQGNSTTTKATLRPMYRIKPVSGGLIEREEVYLVKWRGQSYLHASWERGADIIRMDQSNNTARGKIRKYIYAQELALGMNWKQVLEEERATAANVHLYGDQRPGTEVDLSKVVDEEYYPPGVTEVERILACDESEMDISLFPKQRALNVLNEQEQIREIEKGETKRWNSKEGLKKLATESHWDPEDNVRYIVKWKDLSFAEITWEYCKDIKKDAVDEAEDFWIRQKPPDDTTCCKHIQAHPHMQYFKKIQESPVYGPSKHKRLVAKSVNGRSVPKEDEDEPTNPGFRLRSYQLEGVNWLLFNWWNQRSCILADEMGLGKTIQSIGFIRLLQDLPKTNVRGPFLIVAPLSLIGQWQSESKTWAPDLNVVLYHGSADARDFIIKNDFFFTDQFMSKSTATKLRKQHVTKFHILITTYEVVMKDIEVFTKIKWKALIVDEAHRLKNSKSKLFEELLSVPRDYCLLLTGTPLANATEELWALLHFANTSVFNSKDEFLEKFGQLDNSIQVEELHSILKPYLLRRLKEDVEKSMPPKTETILEVSLTPSQKKFYKAIYERNTTFLFKGGKPSNSPSLMNVMMELRKCCNHPFLMRGAEDRILAEAAQQVKPSELDYVKIFEEQLVKSSGKMVLIDKLLPKLFANGHKVLIFSQMVRVLDLLMEYLKLKRYKYERLDGSTSSSSRVAAVRRFIRKSCQRFVMLLSTRAGGLGLNLTAADIVIIFDSDWNPQNDLQAMARAHRIGQTKAVSVYRLLTAKTYEMHMFHSASMKLGLEQAVLSQNRDQGEEGTKGKKHKSKGEKEAHAKKIDELLKKGAYDVFRDDDDDEARKFMETDIDQLMNSAKNVTYGKQTNNLSSGLGSFSKASFVTDTGEGEKDVDLDDPDFWSKAVGLDKPIDTSEEISHMIDDGIKRTRKQVDQFDPYAELRQAEQKKQEKIDQKIHAEKEEKERIRVEKKRKKGTEKNKKSKNKEDKVAEELRKKEARSLPPPPNSLKKGKKTKENGEKGGKQKSGNKKVLPINRKDAPQAIQPYLKKSKKSVDRRRALRRAENENPAIENLKQAWDVSHRNRAAAACLRFGFSRFTKIRNESNLQALPIQDIEIFFRSFLYQQSLQLAVLFLEKLRDDPNDNNDSYLQTYLLECLGPSSLKELEWLSDCIAQGMHYYLEVENQRRFLRLPLILAEPKYVADLRKGAALRSLRRIYMSSRVERVIGDCVDDIIAELGYEQLGQRGCHTGNISSLDIDMKSRLLSTEEITLSINSVSNKVYHKAPATWWDRSCDIALLLGTFIHGLGNYENMLNDESLSFAYKIRKYAKTDSLCCEAQKQFTSIALAAKKVCDDALEASKLKAQKEVQKAVAAAAAAALKREKEAAALREGGIAADAVMSNMGEQPMDHLYEIKEGKDEHFITLPRVKQAISSLIQTNALTSTTKSGDDKVSGSGNSSHQTDANGADESKGRRKRNLFRTLPMPDARVLDFRLKLLLEEIDRHYSDRRGDTEFEDEFTSPQVWSALDTVSTNQRMRNFSVRFVLGSTQKQISDQVIEYAGIGVNGTQCGVTHRSVDDRTDFSIGAASPELYQVAHGPESPRYLRALGVPMTFGRFGLVALVHADEKCLNYMLANERIRFKCDRKETPSKEIEAKNIQNNTAPGVKNHDPLVKIEAVSSVRPKAEKETEMKDTFQQQPSSSVPGAFQDNAKLRAAVSTVLLYFGYPFVENNDLSMCDDIWNCIREQSAQFGNTLPYALYQVTRFESLLQEFCGDTKIPSTNLIKEYIDECFLPHCLKLCLYGNNATTRLSRGSKGKYETFDGTSCYPEPTEKLQSPLPDPCLLLKEQSIEAVGMASSIIRRVRLMRCILNISSGAIPMNNLHDLLNSQAMRKSMDGLPVWWCPWIHDTALLIHSSTRGLFSILKDRESKESDCHIFSRNSIKQHINSTFFVEDEEIIRRTVTSASTADETAAWIERYANEFPSLNVIERRLAFLCSKMTEKVVDSDSRFENLPMYDHGGWPRN